MQIGVFGGGQLGRMLAIAGTPLGLTFRFLDPDPECPAGALGDVVCGAFDDPRAIDTLLRGIDCVTFEFENLCAASLAQVARAARVAPPVEALVIAQDRVQEKRFFESLGLPVDPWAPVDGPDELSAAIDRVGTPGILKTRRLGYDGKGQRLIGAVADATEAHRSLQGVPCIYERLVSFSRELSIIGVRGHDGALDAWPVNQNAHRNGILHSTIAPAPVDSRIDAELRSHAFRVMERLDYQGVLAIEFFDDHGRLVVNEMAPRVHNSGHWTIEGAVTSQFENHLRAICGLPLGSTAARGHAAMINLVGRLPPMTSLLAEPDLKVHLYGKLPRPGRKLGHLTVVTADAGAAELRLRRLETLIDSALAAV